MKPLTGLRINWRKPNPKDELEMTFLCMLLWRDIWRMGCVSKCLSKYYLLVEDFYSACPLCELNKVKCEGCILAIEDCSCLFGDSLFFSWVAFKNNKAAHSIYKICQERVVELIKERKK